MSIAAYAPDDMTVSVTADTTLAALQQHLAQRGQWLPVDPPHADRVTIGDLVDHDLSGPRRYGYGTVREHVLSVRAELADGRRIKAGANVVKNAAGYDLCRLFTGARGELAILREVGFKVQPLPEVEQFLEARFPTVESACEFAGKLDTSELTPVVLDLHKANGAPWIVVIGFAGTQEDAAWQRKEAERFGPLSDSNLGHEQRFWAATDAGPARKLSVLPSSLAGAIARLGAGVTSLVARAGNGILYYRGGPEPPRAELPAKLMQRLKNEFDPNNTLPVRKG
jgi:FAD/FMN-containing dehydrogenase